MEGGKQSGSSLASDLFGAKDSPTASSSGIFGSIFAPPSKVVGRESLRSSESGKKSSHGNPAWGEKSGISFSDNYGVGGEGQSKSKDTRSYYTDKKPLPFHYSSSIYYGGQDVYFRPESAQKPGLTTTFNEDGVEDDSGSASRGNWWQGSLYY